MILLAGPSGSGKSRVTRLAGCPHLDLDDFYHDGDHPDLPHTLGIVDWDDPASWDADAALAALQRLRDTGTSEVPRYDIAQSRAIGRHRVDLGTARCFLVEGVFAIEMAERCRSTGFPFEALYLDRPRWLVALLRFTRDVRERRKPLPVLIRRGWALFRAEPGLRRRAVAAGFRPVGLRAALAAIGR